MPGVGQGCLLRLRGSARTVERAEQLARGGDRRHEAVSSRVDTTSIGAQLRPKRNGSVSFIVGPKGPASSARMVNRPSRERTTARRPDLSSAKKQTARRRAR
jgi:hypothetical protein